MSSWDAIPNLVDTKGWVALGESEFDALIAWTAGPENVGRVATEAAPEPEPGDGRVDRYLADAGIPPRPRGFVWYLRVPPETPAAEDFVAGITAVAHDTPPAARVSPLLRRERLEQIMAFAYPA
ncbi:DUF5956 family protein [Galbitalea soli]|uniref:Uncharacterized protein n=1 Tax=Galbitalea soli TaxID=1268042 RepID=A0A7C9PLV5_9MICO|nr:hypothetical protein [Galbitalea soli]NYJ31019.1 hypothetical protein [Galbitalea soli]